VTDLTIASEARGDLLRRGASAWERVAAKTSGNVLTGDGTDAVSAAIATPLAVAANANLAALGVMVVPVLSTGSVVDGTDMTGVATATAFTVTIGNGALANAQSELTLTWPADVSHELTFRVVNVKAGGSAGDQQARVVLTFGGGLAWVWPIVCDQNGNVTMQGGYDWPGTPHGKDGSSATRWIRVRVDGTRISVYVSNTSTFGGPIYDDVGAGLVIVGASTSATIATLKLAGQQVTTTADVGGNTVTIDNVTIKRL